MSLYANKTFILRVKIPQKRENKVWQSWKGLKSHHTIFCKLWGDFIFFINTLTHLSAYVGVWKAKFIHKCTSQWQEFSYDYLISRALFKKKKQKKKLWTHQKYSVELRRSNSGEKQKQQRKVEKLGVWLSDLSFPRSLEPCSCSQLSCGNDVNKQLQLSPDAESSETQTHTVMHYMFTGSAV